MCKREIRKKTSIKIRRVRVRGYEAESMSLHVSCASHACLFLRRAASSAQSVHSCAFGDHRFTPLQRGMPVAPSLCHSPRMSRLLNVLPRRSQRPAFACISCLDRLSAPASRHLSISSGAFAKTLPRAAAITPASVKTFSTTATRLAKGHSPRELLPSGPARTRFAPSPTGYLLSLIHI